MKIPCLYIPPPPPPFDLSLRSRLDIICTYGIVTISFRPFLPPYMCVYVCENCPAFHWMAEGINRLPGPLFFSLSLGFCQFNSNWNRFNESATLAQLLPRSSQCLLYYIIAQSLRERGAKMRFGTETMGWIKSQSSRPSRRRRTRARRSVFNLGDASSSPLYLFSWFFRFVPPYRRAVCDV